MPSSSSESTRARRVLVEDIREDKKGWLRHGVAALVVSVLGLGVAGSIALTGAAQHTSWTASVATTDLGKQTSRGAGVRGTERARLDPARIKSLADQREEELGKINAEVIEASMDRSAAAREKALAAIANATRRQAILIARGQAKRSDPQAPLANAGSSGRLLAHQGRVQHRCGLRPGRPVVALPHRLRLLLSRRYPVARFCGWGRHQRRDWIRQRLGRQLCCDQARGWHPHAAGAYVDGLGPRRPDCVWLPECRSCRA